MKSYFKINKKLPIETVVSFDAQCFWGIYYCHFYFWSTKFVYLIYGQTTERSSSVDSSNHFSGHFHPVSNQSCVLHAWIHDHKTILPLLGYGARLTLCCCKQTYSFTSSSGQMWAQINLHRVGKEISLHAAARWKSLQTSRPWKQQQNCKTE